jgi:hypothetical protein
MFVGKELEPAQSRDLDLRATKAIEQARKMPLGHQRSDALKEADLRFNLHNQIIVDDVRRDVEKRCARSAYRIDKRAFLSRLRDQRRFSCNLFSEEIC